MCTKYALFPLFGHGDGTVPIRWIRFIQDSFFWWLIAYDIMMFTNSSSRAVLGEISKQKKKSFWMMTPLLNTPFDNIFPGSNRNYAIAISPKDTFQ